MVDYVIGEQTYHIDNTLGVTRKIKKAFNKDYFKVLEGLNKMSLEDLMKFIYTCLIDTGYDNLADFIEYMETDSGLGYMDIFEFVGEINNQIQHPGKSKEDIKKITMERLKEQRELENI